MGVTFNLLFIPNTYKKIAKILDYLIYAVLLVFGLFLLYLYFIEEVNKPDVFLYLVRFFAYIIMGIAFIRGLFSIAKRDEQAFIELNEDFIFIKDQRYDIEDVKDIRIEYGGSCGQHIHVKNEIETASGKQNTIYFMHNGKLIVHDFFIETRVQWSETQEIIELWQRKEISVGVKKTVFER